MERAAGELQQRLVQKSEQVRRVQSEASSSNGTLAACTAELNQQRQEADTLQNRLEASLAQINSQVGSATLKPGRRTPPLCAKDDC